MSGTITAATYKVSMTKSLLYIPIVPFCVNLCDMLYLNCSLMSVLFFMMVIDYLTGFYKSYQLNLRITKSRFVAGLFAKVTVFLLLLAIGLMLYALGIVSPSSIVHFDLESYMSYVIFLLIVNEGYSITGNIISAREKQEIVEVDFITLAIRKFRVVFEKKLDTEIERK